MDKIERLEQQLEKTKNSLSKDRLDMSFAEIMNMFERKEIIIDPDFQRLFRWDDYQKTRFIESILTGIPVPPIFVAENKEGNWELVDGLQRIATVLSFFGLLKNDREKNDWILTKGDLLEDLEGLGCQDLSLKLKLGIKRVSCRIEIIHRNKGVDMRHELFNRLHTGGAALTNQEIRNCICRGVSTDFNIFLRKCSENPDFMNLIQPTEKQVEELYLDELVLRFCSLIDSGDISENIAKHMTRYMEEAVKNTDKISGLEDRFMRTIKVLKPVGPSVFRKTNAVFSTGLYDCVMLGTGKYIDHYEKESTDLLIKKKLNSSNNLTVSKRIPVQRLQSNQGLLNNLKWQKSFSKPEYGKFH